MRILFTLLLTILTGFGGGKKKAEPIVQETTQRFATFKPKTALDPHWGNDICQQLASAYK